VSHAVTQSDHLLERGDVRGAADLLQRAVQAGDALAARELATWLLTGQYVRRDLAESRAMFEHSAGLGDQVSAGIVRAFVAGGVGGQADWPRALGLLREAAASDPVAAAQLRLVESMNLSRDGEPGGTFPSEPLSEEPEIRRFPGFFTPDECAYLVATAEPLLQPSLVVDPTTGRLVPNPIRTSSGVGFPFTDENPAIHALNRRIAAASGTDVKSGEPLQILHYAPGERYHEHNDALPGVAPTQQRVLTFLVYLDDDYDGGETAFPRLGLSVKGCAGDGLLFRNATADGAVDPLAIHAGLPVTRGVKHVASRWIRATPLIVE